MENIESKAVFSSEKRKISLVIPFYNEEEGIRNTFHEIEKHIGDSRYEWEIIAINDGSSDKTLEVLGDIAPSGYTISVVDLSRNFGKEAALSAGLCQATGDAIIPLDADLQDPPSLISDMIQKWEEGYDVVLAKRLDRTSDSVLKRYTAAAFYSVINKMSEVAIPENVGDFRLMDRRVVNVITSLPETRRFMKGLFAWAGFRTTTVEYVRPARAAGDTKFSGWKLWNLALEGVTSFSTIPLKIWSYIGFLVAIGAFGYGALIVIRTLIFGIDIPGYASLISILLFVSGLQMVGLGILGEYVGRIYMESKNRPPFIVRSVKSRQK
ncbi:glycosyltransferase family 2 protein [Pseudomonas sp. LABIM340]|uniref:glycosyltransferase family 2 protein n=1 Tax=Pseudomonas sp. LABIM340 TaxID=3156585 RepID=UPI0032AF7F7C